MKLSIDIECTAQEAREFLGLPDVRELQSKWMQEIEAKIADEALKFSPESILQTWTAGAAGNMDGVTDIFKAFIKAQTKG